MNMGPESVCQEVPEPSRLAGQSPKTAFIGIAGIAAMPVVPRIPSIPAVPRIPSMPRAFVLSADCWLRAGNPLVRRSVKLRQAANPHGHIQRRTLHFFRKYISFLSVSNPAGTPTGSLFSQLHAEGYIFMPPMASSSASACVCRCVWAVPSRIACARSAVTASP